MRFRQAGDAHLNAGGSGLRPGAKRPAGSRLRRRKAVRQARPEPRKGRKWSAGRRGVSLEKERRHALRFSAFAMREAKTRETTVRRPALHAPHVCEGKKASPNTGHPDGAMRRGNFQRQAYPRLFNNRTGGALRNSRVSGDRSERLRADGDPGPEKQLFHPNPWPLDPGSSLAALARPGHKSSTCDGCRPIL